MQSTRASASAAERPSDKALEQAIKASHRARRNAQVRLRFISDPDREPGDPPPPLARMLRGGRGGVVRLKLYLSYLWMQTNERGVVLAIPSQAWALLLGLDHPETSGVRRVNEAQAWLENKGFITTEAHPGHANRVTVLEETGNGEPYLAPGAAANKLRDSLRAALHYYTQIPATFWTNGYFALLTGTGLAMYLILHEQHGPFGVSSEPVWFAPSVLQNRYGLSEDTRAKGIRDLTSLGLVTVSRRVINPHDFDIPRIRNVYALNPNILNEPARRTHRTIRETM